MLYLGCLFYIAQRYQSRHVQIADHLGRFHNYPGRKQYVTPAGVTNQITGSQSWKFRNVLVSEFHS